jgi:hypothetical protein
MIVRCEVSVHAQPAKAVQQPDGALRLPEGWPTAPWGRTFDEAYAALGELPRLYAEPDGSFAWTSPPGEERWQLTGCLYDRGPELAYVDLFGQCDQQSLAALFRALRGPGTELMIQFREQGTFITANSFLADPGS